MKNLLKNFVCGEEGFLLSTEGLLVATISVLGLIVGIVAVRNAIVLELDDFAAAVGALNQTYVYTGVSDPSATTNTTAGGTFTDETEATDLQSIIVTVAGGAET
ncbi:MAG: hypothetical protein ACKOEO_14955 [Planctomycetaceae bacterium]